MRHARVLKGGVLIVLAPGGPEFRDLLTAKAIRLFERACVFRDAGELLRQASRHRAPVVLVPAADAAGIPTAPVISALRERSPASRVGLMCTRGAATGRLVLAAIRAGAAEILLEGADWSAALERLHLARAPESAAVDRFVDELDLPPGILVLCLRAATARAGRCSVPQLAADVGASTNALVRECRADRLPTPRAIIRWSRVLVAVTIAQSQGTGVRSLARRSGFASTHALRLQLLRCVGLDLEALLALTPHELRRRLRTRLLGSRLRRG